MPSLLIMDLKYMLKSVNTMVGEFIEFMCKIVDFQNQRVCEIIIVINKQLIVKIKV